MTKPRLIAIYLIVLFFLHQDFWFRDNPSLVFGFLPVTLAWHMLFTAAAATGWWMVGKFAWPVDEDENPATVIEGTETTGEENT